MYERLKDKNVPPTYDDYMLYIGISRDLFVKIDSFLVSEFNADKTIKFSAHDRCWGIDYRTKKDVIGMLYFEKDAFMAVIRLDSEGINSTYNELSSYTKNCIENSPYRHNGYIEYRVTNPEQIDDLKAILTCRVSRKHRSIPQT